MTSLDQAWLYLESFIGRDTAHLQAGRAYRLQRMRQLAQVAGEPQQHYRIFHVAGSKGKGSTATMLAHALAASGAVVGLFTSPHLRCFTERMRVFNHEPYQHLILQQLADIRQALQRQPLALQPTFFELITLLALCVFRRCGCRFVVLEVGLGGRLDATNIVTPVASIITPIEREHSAILGETLALIAGEKAGIIKEGVPVFSAAQPPEVREVLQDVADRRRAALTLLADVLASSKGQTCSRRHGALRMPTGQRFWLSWREGHVQQGTLPLLGQVQLDNAALVLAVLRTLQPAGRSADWLAGLAGARLAARCQFLPFGSSVLCLDGAHTVASMAATLATFLPASEGGRRRLVFTALPDKNYRQMVEQLAPHFQDITVCQLGSSFKQADCSRIVQAFARLGRRVSQVACVRTALQQAQGADYILVCGSFYLAGEALELVNRAADWPGSGKIPRAVPAD